MPLALDQGSPSDLGLFENAAWPKIGDLSNGLGRIIFGIMSELLVVPATAALVEAPPEDPRASKRLRWFELVLLLSIALGGYIFSSVFILVTGQSNAHSSPIYQWGFSLFNEVTALLLLGYILWRRGLRFKNLGLRWSLGDLTTGVAVAIGAYWAYVAGYLVIHAIHQAIFGPAQGVATSQAIFGHPRLIGLPFFLLNPFFEELIVRAYLMTEIRALTGSAALSVVVSVAVQTTYHLYYGWQGALSLGFMFLFFSVYYAKTRKATPLIVAHGAFDLITLFRLW
jgi:membrane protease YdiL (CAAX protease family)